MICKGDEVIVVIIRASLNLRISTSGKEKTMLIGYTTQKLHLQPSGWMESVKVTKH